jgi:hypothetical protein
VPRLLAGPEAITQPKVLASRLTYPGTEQSFNGTNLAAAIGALPGGDKLTTPLWWDTTPETAP